jgi:hypothetical protein
MSAGLDHVEFARKKHHELTSMANATGDATCLIAGAPIDIGARRPDNRRSRILRDHQAVKG